MPHPPTGALSGWVEASITYPTEYVKVMLQLDDTGGAQKRFRSSFDVIQQTVRTHGIFGVYRGFSVVFCGNVPKYIFRFGSFEQFKPFLADANGQLSPTNKLICGLGAGVCEALFAVIPMDSVKIKFINDRVSPQPKYRGLVDGIRSLIREKGIGATYQGVTPTLLKQGSNQMIRFFVFESLKEWYDGPGGPNANGQHSSKLVYPVFGAIAGAASVFGNTPLDVVKTRMQGLGSDQFSSTWDCVQKMYRNEGLRSFYKGLGPRLTKVSMEVAIAFTMYNTFLDLFAKL